MQANEPEAKTAGAASDPTAGRSIRRFAVGVAAVLLLGFLAVHFVRTSAARKVANETAGTASALPVVNVVTAQQAPATAALSLPGETAAWYQSTIYARVDGYVGRWTADIGDTVRKGQIMATIETPDLDAQLASARAKVKADQAQIESEQAALALAKVTYERWRDSPRGVVSEQERDSTKAGYESAAAQLESAKAQLAVDQAHVDRYSVLSGFKQVTAPYDGKVIERRIDIGNLVTAGSTANTTLLYRVSQNDPMRVFVDVPQSAAADMRNGVEAAITASNLPGRTFLGKITRTADAIDPHARTLRVEVDLRNPGQSLVPGMYVDVAFRVPTAGMPEVPAAALVFRPSGPQVAVIDQGLHVRLRPVTIARDNGRSIEIGSGLRAGESVVLNISSQIADGDLVQVSRTANNGESGASAK